MTGMYTLIVNFVHCVAIYTLHAPDTRSLVLREGRARWIFLNGVGRVLFWLSIIGTPISKRLLWKWVSYRPYSSYSIKCNKVLNRIMYGKSNHKTWLRVKYSTNSYILVQDVNKQHPLPTALPDHLNT